MSFYINKKNKSYPKFINNTEKSCTSLMCTMKIRKM